MILYIQYLIFILFKKIIYSLQDIVNIMGIGDWGLGIGDW